MHGPFRQILLNSVTGWGSVLVRSAMAFVMVPFLLQQLGRSGFGFVGLLAVLESLTVVADLGLRQTLGRDLAEQVARGNRQGFNELISTGFLLCIVIGSLIAASFILIAPLMTTFFNVSPLQQTMAVKSIMIYGAGIFLISFASVVFTATLTATNRFDLHNYIDAGCKVATGVALVIVLSIVQNKLMGWVLITLAGQGLSLLLYGIAARKTTPWFKISLRHVHAKSILSLLRFGWKVYVIQLTNLVAERSDPIVISRFFGPAGVALYTPGGQLTSVTRLLLTTLPVQFTPLATRQHVENALNKQQHMLTEGTRCTMLLASLFCVGLFVFAEPFCNLWVGQTLGADSRTVAVVIQLWAIADLLASTASMQWPMLLGTRNLNAMMAFLCSTALLNVCLSIYFVGFTTLGVPGALVGTILANLLLRPILIMYSVNVFKLTLSRFLNRALFRPILLVVLLLPIAYAIRLALPPNSYIYLIVCVALTGGAWAVLTAVFALSRAERKLFWAHVRKLFFFRSRIQDSPG